MTKRLDVSLSDREIAVILAALRNWQTDSLNEDMAEEFRDYFVGDVSMLTDDEIDALCERINFSADECEGCDGTFTGTCDGSCKGLPGWQR